MKSKFFTPPIHKTNSTKTKHDYWALAFVSLVFIASMTCFMIDSYQDKKNSLIKSAYTSSFAPTIDPRQHGKS